MATIFLAQKFLYYKNQSKIERMLKVIVQYYFREVITILKVFL